MLLIRNGEVDNPRIKKHIVTGLGHGKLAVVNGIVVHQTGGATASAAFAGYATRPYGTHFLIDKDGTAYQSASLLHYTAHIGKVKARCLVEHRCTPIEMKAYAGFNPTAQNQLESGKSFPARYPTNRDSIGIELVGEVDKATQQFVSVTAQQNASLRWLVRELADSFHVSMHEVYRHPQLSWKQPSEASTARW